MEDWIRPEFDTSGSVRLVEQYARDMSLDDNVDALADAVLKSRMQIAGRCILTLPVWRNITPRTPYCIDGVEVREIVNLGPT